MHSLTKHQMEGANEGASLLLRMCTLLEHKT